MARYVFADELTMDECERLLSDPCSELLSAIPSGRNVIRYHVLEDKQLYWLARELGYKPWSDTLYEVLEAICRDEPVYLVYFKRKRGGGSRKILVPRDSLKDVQRRVLDNILTMYPVSDSAFGYSGGSVFDAIRPHIEAGNKTLFSTDIKDAFGSVWFKTIFEVIYGLPLNDSYEDYSEKGYLSWEVAYALCRIMTSGRCLPQGAPTSPRLFDMVFLQIDRGLKRLAENVEGTYTRFADNIYFSMPKSKFPDVVARAIIRTIHENRHDRDRGGLMDARRFMCHKVCTRSLGEEAIRVLGVNVAHGEIQPTRELKRRIRLSIHRMNWLLLNTPYDNESIAKCWGVLQGQMSFASQAIVPEPLLVEYERVRDCLEGLFYDKAVNQ